MEPIKIDRNSWHFKIVTWLVDDDPKDICTYRRTFIITSFVISILGFLLIVSGWAVVNMIVNMILGLIFSILYGAWILTEAAIVGFICLVSFGTFLGVRGVYSWYKRRKMDRDEGPGVVTLAYRSWKEKHCAPVIIE